MSYDDVRRIEKALETALRSLHNARIDSIVRNGVSGALVARIGKAQIDLTRVAEIMESELS